MGTKKRLQDLTIKDNFMFCAVMSEEENCIRFLELVLGFSISKIDVSYEQNMVYHPEYKGIRLDVYAKDQNNTHYNVEMQVRREPALPKRAPYYHSQMDMELLTTGTEYEELPDTFVIFVCDFDPFDKELYCYTMKNKCVEDNLLEFEDGCRTIFLSTKGKNETKVSGSLVKFLKFVAMDIEQSEQEFEDEFVNQIQKSIHNVKESREMGERYMIFEEMMRDERRAGRLEAKLQVIYELLEDIGEISEDMKNRINEVNDENKLRVLYKLAAKVETIEEFEKGAQKVLSSAEACKE